MGIKKIISADIGVEYVRNILQGTSRESLPLISADIDKIFMENNILTHLDSTSFQEKEAKVNLLYIGLSIFNK